MNPKIVESVALVMNLDVVMTAFVFIGIVLVCLAVAGFTLVRRKH